MKENIIRHKSFDFAVRIVNLYKYLTETKKEYVLSKQVLRSGTSIGANIEESIGGRSDKEFLFKLEISYKEARETIYWLKLLKATDYISSNEFDSIFNEADEVCRILAKIILTLKGNKNSLKVTADF
ncbi:four helix bundle protein [Flavobacterium chungbukense]|uniref:Four helix bundle protein n=1 Tax=Flavobacterium chungbukense TaxID=877464 RepID=A0ABP7YA90_9FLAO|nr:four helix bundle protein [Flavobacterium chungbukense]MCC4922515.1 four helix bundle protein [Flavobacterium chungbukense]